MLHYPVPGNDIGLIAAMTMLRAHDGKPQVIIAGGCNDSICAGTDGGLTWTVTGPGLPFAPYIMAAANPDGSRFFIGSARNTRRFPSVSRHRATTA